MRTDDLPNWVPKGAVLQHHIFSRAKPIGPNWSRPGPDLVPSSVQTQPNQPKWSRLPEKLKFQPWAQVRVRDDDEPYGAAWL